jgi:hypothetical protein
VDGGTARSRSVTAAAASADLPGRLADGSEDRHKADALFRQGENENSEKASSVCAHVQFCVNKEGSPTLRGDGPRVGSA